MTAEQVSRADDSVPRDVKVLGAVSLAQDSGSEMLFPFLPTFLTGVLGAPVLALALAEGLADAASAGMKLVAGRVTTQGRRRPWIAAGYGLAALGKLVVCLAFVWPVVLIGRVVDRFGKGIRGVPRDALIADVSPPHVRGRAFGLHRSMDTAGAVIGPLAGLAVYHLLDHRIRWVMVIAVVPALLSVALVGLVREAPRPPAPEPTPGTGAGGRPGLPTGYWSVVGPLTVFAFVNSSDALLLQRAHELGLSLSLVVTVYVLYNVVYAALGYPAGRMSDRRTRRGVFAVGLVVFAVVYMGLGTARSAWAVWALLPLYGAYTALTDGVARAWVAGLAPGPERSWALGVHSATTGVAVIGAGLWSGLTWGDGGRFPLVVSGLVALAVAAWLALVRPAGQSAEG